MEQPKIKMIPLLYIDKGFFEFSDEFKEKYKELYGIQMPMMFDFEFEYDEFNDNFRNIVDYDRFDEKYINIYKLLGSEKSSKYSTINIKYLPEEFKKYIILYSSDGFESEMINYGKMYEEIAKNIDKVGTYLPEHKQKMERIQFIKEHYNNQEYCEYVN
jgi:hypothetical protein